MGEEENPLLEGSKKNFYMVYIICYVKLCLHVRKMSLKSTQQFTTIVNLVLILEPSVSGAGGGSKKNFYVYITCYMKSICAQNFVKIGPAVYIGTHFLGVWEPQNKFLRGLSYLLYTVPYMYKISLESIK